MNELRVLDLFSGIGGFSLGLERTGGFRTAAFCEIEPYCRAVLRKHWPGIPIHGDVTTLRGADVGHVDVICGGFPCQDISLAGKGAGLAGERSGLWFEYRRIIEEVRPAWVIIENVSALRSRGLGVVLGQLAALGYDAEWHCIPAAAVGAPHRRDRVWIVAYPQREQLRQQPGRCSGANGAGAPLSAEYGQARPLAYANGDARHEGRACDAEEIEGRRHTDRGCVGQDVADPLGAGLEGRPILAGHLAEQLAAIERSGAVSDADRQSLGRTAEPRQERGHWFSEPDVGRVAHGVPARVDRLRALGNAVVPQIPEIIGRAILEAEGLTA